MAQNKWEKFEKRWEQCERNWDQREQKMALREAKGEQRFSQETNNQQQPLQTSDRASASNGASNAFQKNTFTSANVSVSVRHADIVTNGPVNITNINGSTQRKKIRAKKPLTESQDIPDLAFLRKLSEELGYNWKTVGRELGFRDGVLENLESDNGNNAAERNYKMFEKWKDQNGSDATKEKLAKALNNAGSGDLADDLADDN